MTRYLYWPVSGAMVFWREGAGIREAQHAAAQLRAEWPAAEVERIGVGRMIYSERLNRG